MLFTTSGSMIHGHTKVYLKQPVTIREIMMDLSHCKSVGSIVLKTNGPGMQYSSDLAYFYWKCGGGMRYKFECGTQWGDKHYILVVGPLL